MKTIMFVEDDSVLVNVFVRKLQEIEGIKLLLAWDGEQAVELLSRHQPDILVTGINMPKMNGLDLLKHVRGKDWKFPVLVLTNMSDKKFIKEVMKAGATEYLVKNDVTMHQLWEILEKYLYGKQKGVIMNVAIKDIALPEAVKHVSKEYIDAEKAYPPFSKSNTDYNDVIKTLDKALQLLPDDPVLLGKKGNCLEALQKYDEALTVYEHALSKYPTFLPNMYNKVFCLERLGRNEECNAYFDEIIKHYPYEVKALANKAKIFKRLKRWSEALDYCHRALLLDSNDFSARYVLEETENHLFGGGGRGRNSEAAGGSEIGNNLTRLMSVESALAKDPKDTKLLGLKGNFLEALCDHKKALEVYEEALKYAPKDLPNLYNKAFCLARMKRFKECINCCNAIAQISDHDSKALALKGEILKKMNRLQEGLWCSYMALYNDPSEPTAQNNIEEISAIFDGKTSNKYAVFANLKLDNLWSKLKWRMMQLDRRLFPSSLRNKNPQGHLFFSAEPPPKDFMEEKKEDAHFSKATPEQYAHAHESAVNEARKRIREGKSDPMKQKACPHDNPIGDLLHGPCVCGDCGAVLADE